MFCIGIAFGHFPVYDPSSPPEQRLLEPDMARILLSPIGEGERCEILGTSTARRDAVMARDPVCGLRLDDAKGAKGIADEVAYTSEYEGLTYYFCSRRCK